MVLVANLLFSGLIGVAFAGNISVSSPSQNEGLNQPESGTGGQYAPKTTIMATVAAGGCK